METMTNMRVQDRINEAHNKGMVVLYSDAIRKPKLNTENF